MSILAEPRRKQRISIDPNNLQWRDDDNKKGKKMMEKMGWSDGNGLGRNKQGNVDAVKLKANYSGKGLGADKIASYDSTWIGHHDDFADLLAALNKNKPKSEETEEEKSQRMTKMSIELSSKSVKRRIHYQKFTRMKDTANYSAQDKSAVLGVGLKRTKEESDEDTKEKSDSDSGVTTGNTTVSQLSVGDYFAAKMAALKANSQACATVKQEKLAVKEEEPEDEEYRVGFNQIGFSYEDIKVEIKEELVEETEGDEKARRKREKKLRKQKERELAEAQVEEPEVDEEEAERLRRKEEKRQKKLAKRQMEDAQSDEPEELTEKQRRKMEKRQRKLEEAEEVEEPKKKKSKE